MRRVASTVALTVLGLGFGAACSGKPAAAPTPAVTTPQSITSSSTSSTLGPLAPPNSLGAEQVADTGLPSHIGPGALSKAKIKSLMQFFENKVSDAYAHGDAAELAHYLAGPMLSGNRATIELLNQKDKHNVFKINVKSISVDANQKHRIVFDMTGDMTVDYFFNTQTRKLIDNGLPGPSQVQFLVFLDQNPKTHTWYWTGEQSDASASGSGSDTGSSDG